MNNARGFYKRTTLNSLLLVLAILLLAQPVLATVRIVTNTNDSGAGSLRNAVTLAQNGDVVRLSPALIANGTDTIKLQSTINITKGIQILGTFNATHKLYISGESACRIFTINFTSSSSYNVNLDSLLLVNGHDQSKGGGIYFKSVNQNLIIKHSSITHCELSGGQYLYGGGIYADGPLVVQNSEIAFNKAVVFADIAAGGGIYALKGLVMDSTRVIENKIKANDECAGGGIYLLKSGQITYSTISNNTTHSTGDDSYGGGLCFGANTPLSALNIDNCTFSDNYMWAFRFVRGGGIYFRGGGNIPVSSVMLLRNSTIYGNKIIGSDAAGGGVSGENADSSAITNCTIVRNIIQFTGCGGGSGLSASWEHKMSVYGSIVAQNQGGPSVGVSWWAIYKSRGKNIYSDTIQNNPTDYHNVTASELALDTLNYNGGPTKTAMPGITSIAINVGDPTDTSYAQNGPISGCREIGSAENCNSITHDSVVACNSFTWDDGNTYYGSTHGVYYTIPGVGENGCDSIWVLRLYIPTFDSTITQHGSYLLSHAHGGTYQWLRYDTSFTLIPGETTQKIMVTQNGCYAVQITKNGCVDTSMVFCVQNIAIQEHDELAYFSIYPNPVSSGVHIGSFQESIKQIQVFNLQGKALLSTNYTDYLNMIELDLSGLPNGIYIIQVNANQRQRIVKL